MTQLLTMMSVELSIMVFLYIVVVYTLAGVVVGTRQAA